MTYELDTRGRLFLVDLHDETLKAHVTLADESMVIIDTNLHIKTVKIADLSLPLRVISAVVKVTNLPESLQAQIRSDLAKQNVELTERFELDVEQYRRDDQDPLLRIGQELKLSLEDTTYSEYELGIITDIVLV